MCFNSEGQREVSIYSGQPLATTDQITGMFDALGVIYPVVRDKYNSQAGGWARFVAVMSMAIRDRHFTYDQLKDAYNRILETPTYNGQLEISAMLDCDIKIKVYCYEETNCGLDKRFEPATFYEPKEGAKYQWQRKLLGSIKFSNGSIVYVKVQDYEKAKQLFNRGVRTIWK